MKMTKKLLGLFLSATLALSLAACGSTNTGDTSSETKTEASGEVSEPVVNDEGYSIATDLTTEEIELTYFHFDSEVTVEKLAEKFMELYPNITVKTEYCQVSDSNTTLLNLVNNGQTPDCFMFSDADFALSNYLLYDISEFWANDPDAKKVASTINDLGIGCYGTEQRYAAPMKFFPGIVYVDLNVLETLNIEAPRLNWTWNEMITLIKDATDLTATPAYYGLGAYNRLDSLYGIAASQDIQGEFGFNGKTFDLSIWAVGEQEFADLKLNGYVAPDTETQKMEDWLGDWEGWFGNSNRVAVFTEAYWTYMNLWGTDAYQEAGMDIVPYVIPAVDEVEGLHNSIATIDMGGVSSGTEYPREAYELLKFMGWGVDGWKTKLEVFSDPTITNAAGVAMKHDSMPAPITTDEEIWAGYRALYPTDEEHGKYWDAYFESCMQPIPFGWMSIAGYWNFCDQYFNSIGIHGLVDSGTAKAADYAEEATEQANYYHAEAMKDYFDIDINAGE